MKKITIGIVAHVDAGKTTLSEMLLYLSGAIREPGRVDHRSAFLDTYEMERERGITIFSKQAVFSYEDVEFTLLDTPGHADFSAEMERTLQVLDCAVLVISGTDGVQSHTRTLWKLLRHYGIPTVLFINKMDLQRKSREEILGELKSTLDTSIVDFLQEKESLWEEIALCDEELTERFLDGGEITASDIAGLVREEKLFSCFSGSALKGDGVETLLSFLSRYSLPKELYDEFAARVFKITRDGQGQRLSHIKILGGSLKVKDIPDGAGKVDQIRIYSGDRFVTTDRAEAGTVCAVTGWDTTRAGQGLGRASDAIQSIMEPVLTYKLLLPQDCNVSAALVNLRQLLEEDPKLHILWNEQLQEIHIQVMGPIQLETLKQWMFERFRLVVDFSAGSICYKETIAQPVVGVGHYEPLRHYAEAQVYMEPLETGAGLQFETICSEDDLDRNWQRLILTHLAEKEHLGVLTGSPITDMKITLVAGKAHLKHTEGGDFRQATYRAVRQGLKKAQSILLEPVYSFRLEVPNQLVGRAMSDLQRLSAKVNPPESFGETSVLEGMGPVATLQEYGKEVTGYSKGMGQFFCTLKGYEPCHNQEEVLENTDYDSERDLENPTGSVFCSHGAGFVVPWDCVDEYKHLNWEPGQKSGTAADSDIEKMAVKYPSRPKEIKDTWESDKELEAIFEKTFGTIKRNIGEAPLGYEKKKTPLKQEIPERYRKAPAKKGKEYLLVDGYNIIFAWEDLKEIAKTDLHGARTRLMDVLCNYQGYRQCEVMLVFDAYKVKGNPGSMEKYNGIYVVYTKEKETADTYIEKTTHEIAKNHQVTVATSDGLEQMIVIGEGACRLSAMGLLEEINRKNGEIREKISP